MKFLYTLVLALLCFTAISATDVYRFSGTLSTDALTPAQKTVTELVPNTIGGDVGLVISGNKTLGYTFDYSINITGITNIHIFNINITGLAPAGEVPKDAAVNYNLSKQEISVNISVSSSIKFAAGSDEAIVLSLGLPQLIQSANTPLIYVQADTYVNSTYYPVSRAQLKVSLDPTPTPTQTDNTTGSASSVSSSIAFALIALIIAILF